jgi:predicted ArsR family transcriptional regulator
VAVTRLDVLKALGDTTRYAIYTEVARSPRPVSTAELAGRLDLHANTVRPHLERMREVGLLDLHVDARGGVGRPQHRYAVAADAPSLGFEPPVMPLLAQMVLRLAERMGASGADAAAIGQSQGSVDAARYAEAPSSLEALVAELDRLGFDPLVSDGTGDDDAIVAFGHCPFREVAETHPELVCSLHRGLVEGFIEQMADAEVASFCTLVDRTPCQVAISAR